MFLSHKILEVRREIIPEGGILKMLISYRASKSSNFSEKVVYFMSSIRPFAYVCKKRTFLFGQTSRRIHNRMSGWYEKNKTLNVTQLTSPVSCIPSLQLNALKNDYP